MTTQNLLRTFLASVLAIIIFPALPATAATFTVTNTADSGPGSLRDALTQANSNAQADTINFDPEFFATARTIVLAGELQITADGTDPGRLVTINGPGRDRLTISGNNAVRPFYVAFQASLAMSGITVRDGNGVGSDNDGTSGGGISCASLSNLTLTNMVIRNNTSPRNGGGILVAAARSFTLLDSVVTENSAGAIGGIWETGSAVKVIRNTTISDNTAKQHVGGAAFERGTFTMENCVVTGNKAATVFGGQTGGLDFFAVNGTVTDTLISNNSAGLSTDGSANPGGQYGGISADGGAMTFRRVTVSGNRCSERGSAGGMYLRGDKTVIDSLISGNDSGAGAAGGGGGGGILTATAPGPIAIINTTFAGNASRTGGGIHNFTAGLSVINSTFVNNVARTRQSFRDGGGDNSGGGIFNDSGGTVTVQNSILAGNSGPSGPDVAGSFTSNGYNIIGNATNSTGFGAMGDQLNVDPLMDPNGLQNNGGPTLTVALQPNSPAIDKGKTVADATTDQRGVTRPTDNPSIANAQGGDGSDIGAYEIGASNGVAAKTLGNIATRLPVLRGENVLIAGIIVVGEVPKRVMIRALGPSLAAEGVSGVLEDPTLELYQGDTLLAENDNWREPPPSGSEIEGTGIAPSDDREAAIVRTLAPGAYTAILRGKGDTTGVALVEGYDLDQRENSKLGNIATRGFVGSGDDVLIGGFIVGPNTRVVVRAIGPSLATGGVQGALQDPALELVDSNGAVVRANDNWKGTQRAELEAIGIQPSDDRESALISTLVPGNYTAVVRGVSGGNGVALVEVYNLQ